MNYKKEIIQMLNQLNDERFIRYLYKLIKEMIAKSLQR